MSEPAGQTTSRLSSTIVADAQPRANDVLLTCGVAWAASLIHIQAAIDHIDEYLLYAIFFVALASAQLAWGIALYRSPRHRRLILGAAMSVAVVALWLASRTVGLPVGPDLGRPEPAGLLDLIATADELAIAGLIVLQLSSPRAGRSAGGARFLRGGALCLIVLSSLVLAGGTHAH